MVNISLVLLRGVQGIEQQYVDRVAVRSRRRICSTPYMIDSLEVQVLFTS